MQAHWQGTVITMDGSQFLARMFSSTGEVFRQNCFIFKKSTRTFIFLTCLAVNKCFNFQLSIKLLHLKINVAAFYNYLEGSRSRDPYWVRVRTFLTQNL